MPLCPQFRFKHAKMEEELYDEFGNYIGPDLDDDDNSDSFDDEDNEVIHVW